MTGVQTCALPIWHDLVRHEEFRAVAGAHGEQAGGLAAYGGGGDGAIPGVRVGARSVDDAEGSSCHLHLRVAEHGGEGIVDHLRHARLLGRDEGLGHLAAAVMDIAADLSNSIKQPWMTRE